jgi:hypothetical protein
MFIYISLNSSRFFSRVPVPNGLVRFPNSLFKSAASLGFCILLFGDQTQAASPNGVTYRLRLEDGTEVAYHLEVPLGLQPVKLNPGKWNQPWYATDRISQNAAIVAAVAWAGGLEDHDSGAPSNSLTNLGGSKPGGFYKATYIKVDGAEFRNSPVPNYLVQMNGKIGQVRQTFFADVLEDGRIVRPVPVSLRSELPVRKSRRHRSGQNWGGSKWGGSGEKKKWGGAEEKKKWGGSGEKTKWGGAEQKQKWGGAGQKQKWGGAEEKKKWGGAEEKPVPANQ